MKNLGLGRDRKLRCSWALATEGYEKYHDFEWGFPVKDDFKLFEKLCLESFQAGLSWRTILEKRENFRRVFLNFNFNEVSKFDNKDIERLLNDESIVRHRGKIEAVINNSKRALEIVEEFGSLAIFFWKFEEEISNDYRFDGRPTSLKSEKLSKILKKRGWKFVGPTTVYSFMQAMGLINDHVEGCVICERVKEERKKFRLPK